MNDLEKMQKAFTEINLEFEVIVTNQSKIESDFTKFEYDTAIRLDNGIGYHGFYCAFYFLNGDFKGHGIWE